MPMTRRLPPLVLALAALATFASARDVSEMPGLLDDAEAPRETSVAPPPPPRDTVRDEALPPRPKKMPKPRGKGSRGAGPGVVSIPAGCFRMGTDSLGAENTRPRHEVCVSAFRMDRVPVTQREYVLKTKEAPWELCDGYTCTPPDPDHPAWFVTWYEADDFCHQRGGRLPTEAEYEYALRAGDSGAYAWGDTLARACDHANLADLTLLKISRDWRAFPCSDGSALVDVAGARKANRWGLHDMNGNVWAWTADWYAADAYAKSPRQDPQGPTSGTGRVIRGGSWITGPDGAMAAYRDGLAPHYRYFGAVGFRCVYPAGSTGP